MTSKKSKALVITFRSLCFFNNLAAVDKAYAKADDEVASAENKQVFQHVGDLFGNEHESGDVGEYDQHALENVECLVLAGLKLGQEQGAHHQDTCGKHHHNGDKHQRRVGVGKDSLGFQEYDQGGVDGASEGGRES